jgi:hypothetical protein
LTTSTLGGGGAAGSFPFEVQPEKDRAIKTAQILDQQSRVICIFTFTYPRLSVVIPFRQSDRKEHTRFTFNETGNCLATASEEITKRFIPSISGINFFTREEYLLLQVTIYSHLVNYGH